VKESDFCKVSHPPSHPLGCPFPSLATAFVVHLTNHLRKDEQKLAFGKFPCDALLNPTFAPWVLSLVINFAGDSECCVQWQVCPCTALAGLIISHSLSLSLWGPGVGERMAAVVYGSTHSFVWCFGLLVLFCAGAAWEPERTKNKFLHKEEFLEGVWGVKFVSAGAQSRKLYDERAVCQAYLTAI